MHASLAVSPSARNLTLLRTITQIDTHLQTGMVPPMHSTAYTALARAADAQGCDITAITRTNPEDSGSFVIGCAILRAEHSSNSRRYTFYNFRAELPTHIDWRTDADDWSVEFHGGHHNIDAVRAGELMVSHCFAGALA